tara:strand:- start:3259 stop:3459 length:201 start_codon:yes stop_codon:yes gene_type:complete
MSNLYEAADVIADKADLGATNLVAFVFNENGMVEVVYGSANGSLSYEQTRWFLGQAQEECETLLDE